MSFVYINAALYCFPAILCSSHHHRRRHHRHGSDSQCHRQRLTPAHVCHHSRGRRCRLQCHGVSGRRRRAFALGYRRGCRAGHCAVCAFQAVPECKWNHSLNGLRAYTCEVCYITWRSYCRQGLQHLLKAFWQSYPNKSPPSSIHLAWNHHVKLILNVTLLPTVLRLLPCMWIYRLVHINQTQRFHWWNLIQLHIRILCPMCTAHRVEVRWGAVVQEAVQSFPKLHFDLMFTTVFRWRPQTLYYKAPDPTQVQLLTKQAF